MIWEDLKSYQPLKKEDLKLGFRTFTKIIGANLKAFGFKKKGRKLYRLSNDLLEVIDFDYRGNWTGQNEYFDTQVGLIPLCWPNLAKDYYLVASKEIKEIDTTIKDHYRLTTEYELLADYLTKRIIKYVLPYFEKYNSTAKILMHAADFKYKTVNGGNDINKSNFLILFAELKQHKLIKALEIIENELAFLNRHKVNMPASINTIALDTKLEQWNKLNILATTKNWSEMDGWLKQIENEEIKRLKIKRIKPLIKDKKTDN